jgi:hypothetical protein
MNIVEKIVSMFMVGVVKTMVCKGSKTNVWVF